MPSRRSADRRSPRNGYVLIAVLIVVVVLSLAAYQFTELMTSEYRAAARTGDVAQARHSAVSGVHYAAAVLADPNSLSQQLGGNPYASGAFTEQVVRASENPRLDSRFSLVATVQTSPGVYEQRYGAVIDEAGKLNLNALILLDPTGTVLYAALMTLPNMTPQAADSIVDWLDGDDTPRTNGAESSYYLGLTQPYRAKNGPLNSLDELLLVQGVTPQLLYGTDRNQNGVADDDPNGSQTSDTLRGWADYLTVYGRELNLDSTGALRTNVNDSDDMPGLYDKLTAALGSPLADYIMAYKMFTVSSTKSGSTSGGTSSSGAGSSSGATTGKSTTSSTTADGDVDDTTTARQTATQPMTTTGGPGDLSSAVQTALQAGTATSKRRLVTLLDLMNTQVTLPKAKDAMANAPTLVVASPLNDPTQLNQYLPVLLDKTTTTTVVEMPPRLNINTASHQVLTAFTAVSPVSGAAAAAAVAATASAASGTGAASGAGGAGAAGATGATTSSTAGASSGAAVTPTSGTTGTTTGILSSTDVDNIIAQRAGLNPTDPATVTGAWLVTSGVITPSQFKMLQPFVTGRTMVYRVQSIGYYAQGGPVARVEAVVDTNQGSPRFLYFRELTGLDTPRGFVPPGQQPQ